MLAAVPLSEYPSYFDVFGRFRNDVKYEDCIRLLALPIYSGNSLIIKLKIPRRAKPNDVMARPLEVKTMTHTCRVSQETR